MPLVTPLSDENSAHSPCPCLSGKSLSDCCARLLSGERVAATPEQLMRSRYTAFVLHDSDYLITSWHPDCAMRLHQQDITQSFADTQWQGLHIISSEEGQHPQEAFVTFFARFTRLSSGRACAVYERSRFLYQGNRWYYIDGVHLQAQRNMPCPCGSSKKYKKCCAQ